MIAGEVFTWLRYAGADCRHDVLIRAGWPGAPNHDQGALDAADAFRDGTVAHLRGWWERWRLPRLCPAVHTPVVRGDYDDLTDADPFCWVDVELDGEPVRAYLLADRAGWGDLGDEGPPP